MRLPTETVPRNARFVVFSPTMRFPRVSRDEPHRSRKGEMHHFGTASDAVPTRSVGLPHPCMFIRGTCSFMKRTFNGGGRLIREYLVLVKKRYFRVKGGCTPAWYSAEYHVEAPADRHILGL